MLRISWTQSRTSKSTLQQIEPKKGVVTVVAENIVKFFGFVVLAKASRAKQTQ